jgi:predicted ATPase
MVDYVKKILVMAERGDEARYHLLETVRQYGRDKLLESGDLPTQAATSRRVR